MLIHIGQNEFIDFHHCEMIINLLTVDEKTKKRILNLINKPEMNIRYRAALLTTDGRWTGSTLSAEALAQRGICHPFCQATYLKKEWKTSSHYIY